MIHRAGATTGSVGEPPRRAPGAAFWLLACRGQKKNPLALTDVETGDPPNDFSEEDRFRGRKAR